MEELETLIVQTNDTNDKLDELITVNESSLVQQKEIAESISELNPTLEAILVKIAEDKEEKKDDKMDKKKEKEKEMHHKMMMKTNDLLEELLVESKKPWNTTITLELE